MSDYPVGIMVVAAIGLFSAIMMARQPDTSSTEVQVAQSSPAATTVYPPPVQRNFPAIAQPPGTVSSPPPALVAGAPSAIPTVLPRGFTPPPVAEAPMAGMPNPPPINPPTLVTPVQKAVPMPMAPPPGTQNK